jgi:hypothetical protein
VTVSVGISGLDNHHQAVGLAFSELVNDVNEYPELIVDTTGSVEAGKKGWLEDTIFTVTSAGGAATLVQLVKLWLQRDRKRSLRVTVNRPGEDPFVVEAGGDNMSVDGLKFAVEETLKHSKLD